MSPLALSGALLGLALLAGCGDDPLVGVPSPDAGGPDAQGDAGACAPGEAQLESGACEPAGVPAARCGAGFEPDGDRGCHAVLPEAPCPDGEMAVPGETRCSSVAPCGEGKWGSIPVEATTVYVDASYTGGASDGSAAAPWTSIQEAIDAAEPGAIVAIAAGSYAGDAYVKNKTVRIWGRCPELVEIDGGATLGFALVVAEGAPASEIRGVAVTGPSWGIGLSGSEDLVIDGVWVHDTGSAGIAVADFWGPASLSMRQVLVERVREQGLGVFGATVSIDGIVVRDTQPAADGGLGRGIAIERSDGASIVSMRGSLVERNRDAGITVTGSSVAIDTTLVRDTEGQPDGLAGHGMNIHAADTGDPSDLTLSSSVIANSREVGILVQAATAALEAVVIAGTRPRASDLVGGVALIVELDPMLAAPSSATIRWSLLTGSHDFGAAVIAAHAELESVLLRDTRPREADGGHGTGMIVQPDPGDPLGAGSTLRLRSCRIEHSRGIGVGVVGSAAEITSTAISQTAPVEDSGDFGDGLVVLGEDARPASAVVVGARIDASARAGIACFGGTVELGASTLECNALHLDGESSTSTFEFDDLGGNRCGCDGAEAGCKVLSANLEPPGAADPAGP